jgi:hypothetical protein
MITNSKMTDKNVSYFIILVSHSRSKYIDNMKWLTKIANGWYFGLSFLSGSSSEYEMADQNYKSAALTPCHVVQATSRSSWRGSDRADGPCTVTTSRDSVIFHGPLSHFDKASAILSFMSVILLHRCYIVQLFLLQCLAILENPVIFSLLQWTRPFYDFVSHSATLLSHLWRSGTSRVHAAQTIGMLGDVVCDLHHTRGGDEKHMFSDLASKSVATVCQLFDLKIIVTVS